MEKAGQARAAWMRALKRSAAARALLEPTLAAVVEAHANVRPDAPALLADDATLSYATLAGRSRQWTRWALTHLAPGETVALLMPSRAEYVALWLGVSRAGGVVALLNTTLTGAALLHCLGAARPRHVIVDDAFADRIAEMADALGSAVTIWRHSALLSMQDTCPLRDHERRTPDARDTALLIYTSGTTGLPKAARVSHAKMLGWSQWFAGMMDVTPADRMYDCLPLYHSVGGVVAVGALLAAGGAVAIRPSFSASRFWDEVVSLGCTLFQYIGELCRYLANAPPHRLERAHSLRLCCGNGLRADVWERFRSRFTIPTILEFYASTEGNVSLTNCEGRPGAVGRVPGFLAHRFAVALVRSDPETGELLRDATGRCLVCAMGEVGEMLGRVADGNFEGYTDAEASSRKVLHNVFAPGDAWFRTGDLMRREADGFYVFVDRLGDTFRWKGENVSTVEVADAVASCPGVIDAVVFGVAVPHADGRAGMAAITVGAGFALAALHAHFATRLPRHARPLFVRLCTRIEVTGTFKLAKGQLAREGYGPNAAGEPCFLDDRTASAYVPLDDALRTRVATGLRF